MNLSQWLRKIETLHSRRIDLGLDRIYPIAESFKLLTFGVPVVTVAGTNGKGSIIRALEHIYTDNGYRVAAYTSPHLLDFSERLRYQCQLLDDATWIEAFETVDQARNKADVELSFFEFTTLAALLICQTLPLDLLLLEVGMGGRLDAVNVVDADIAVISSIAIDHTEWLGDSREKIGFEKAGIFKNEQLAVCGDPNPPASLLEMAEKKGVKLYRYQRDFWDQTVGAGWEWRSLDKRIAALPSCWLKRQNVATALMVSELIDLPIEQSKLGNTMSQIKLDGRYEVLQKQCKVIMDVAHNPQAAEYLAERLRHENCKGRVYAIVGMLRYKEVASTLSKFDAVVTDWLPASLTFSQGLPSQELVSHLAKHSRNSCHAFESVASALNHWLSRVEKEDLLLIFGSFHTVAEAKQYFAKRLS